jgi:hypothetical protein
MPPTYELNEVKKLVRNGRYTVTRTAADTAAYDFGLSQSQIAQAVLALTLKDFYKTMPSELKPDRWQDVYKPLLSVGDRNIRAYVKVQIIAQHPGSLAIIISFKQA